MYALLTCKTYTGYRQATVYFQSSLSDGAVIAYSCHNTQASGRAGAVHMRNRLRLECKTYPATACCALMRDGFAVNYNMENAVIHGAAKPRRELAQLQSSCSCAVNWQLQ